MTTFWKKKQFWGALIGIALLWYCVKDVRMADIERLVDRVHTYYLLLALAMGFVFVLLKGLRWRLMVSQQKNVPVTRAVSLYSVGQLLAIVMPALTGQVGRVVLFSQKEGFRKTITFSTIVLEVLFDAVSLIVFMFLTSLFFAFPERYRYVSFLVAAITIATLVALYLFLHFHSYLEELARRTLRDRRPGLYIGTRKFLRSFTKGIEMLRSSQHLAGTLAFSLALWTAHMLVAWFLIRAFAFPLPFAAAAVIMIVNTLVLMVPITPANAGTFEFAVSTSLAAFSVSRPDAVLFALALHLIDLLPVFSFSYTFLHVDRATLKKIKTAHQEEPLLDRLDEEGTFIEEEKEKEKEKV